jgi:NADH:ubiquinone oxidoreductase subunit F (NADH-binding)/NAD-dependent dihydropyrimidine dehydrogenase PreA subunit/(2Fe-2S) ferredoxin
MTTEEKNILVCCDTGCKTRGSYDVAAALEKALEGHPGKDAHVICTVKETGCHGLCERGPVIRIMPDDIAYYRVAPKDAEAIVDALFSGESGQTGTVDRLLYRMPDKTTVVHQKDAPFYAPQLKIALRNVGIVDPSSLPDYLAHGGYEGLRHALTMSSEEILAEVETSGLRGRGGAGFPTGRKWRTAASYDRDPKYVICNGDEGDPGAFMDRSILEGDPHSVIEGMIICGLAIGSSQGFLYIRDEYDSARRRIVDAIRVAEEAGYLGDSILGTDHAMHLEVVRGGGAFVCGESTALMTSIEGKVGEPRAKYIRSVERGLWGQPSVLNNVETWASVPVVLSKGGAEFAKIGTDNSKGTKVFALVGKVKNTGLVEVPMGTTLRELIFDIGGGIQQDRPFKAVQTGGPSGGCIPDELLDLHVDFDSLKEHGAMMGSGGMIVMDDRNCMVEVARYYVKFLSEESCGKCTPCREGLRQMLHMLTEICEGRGKMEYLDMLTRIASMMEQASLCSLGKTAANPVLSTLRFFKDEYVAHIEQHACPAGVCTALTRFRIDPDACIGCNLCTRACPADAISGGMKEVHEIDQDVCIVCGSCREACRSNAVIVEGRG